MPKAITRDTLSLFPNMRATSGQIRRKPAICLGSKEAGRETTTKQLVGKRSCRMLAALPALVKYREGSAMPLLDCQPMDNS